jgi:hypothetical protein
MGLPFTHQQFVGILQQYNLATWPVAIVFYLLALAVLFLIFSDQPYADRIICGILAVFWLWMGVAYHLLYFSVINKVAYLFGALFIAQGVIFIGCGVVRARLRYRYLDNLRSVVAAILVFYAIGAYTYVGTLAGQSYPGLPLFGAPCPTTIFTLGVLLWATRRVPWWVATIPLLWALIGSFAAFKLGIVQDYGLLIAGIVAAAYFIMDRRTGKASSGAKADA